MKLLGIGGSLRAGSHNAKLMWAAAELLPPGVELTVYEGLRDLPPYDEDLDGDTIVLNSAQGRVKDKNIRRDPRVAISVTDPDNPYKALTVRGKVTQITLEGAAAHIDKMAKKYLGKDSYPFRKPGEVRVIYRVEPQVVSAM